MPIKLHKNSTLLIYTPYLDWHKYKLHKHPATQPASSERWNHTQCKVKLVGVEIKTRTKQIFVNVCLWQPTLYLILYTKFPLNTNYGTLSSNIWKTGCRKNCTKIFQIKFLFCRPKIGSPLELFFFKLAKQHVWSKFFFCNIFHAFCCIVVLAC